MVIKPSQQMTHVFHTIRGDTDYYLADEWYPTYISSLQKKINT